MIEEMFWFMLNKKGILKEIMAPLLMSFFKISSLLLLVVSSAKI